MSSTRVLCVDDNEFVIEAMRRKLGKDERLAFAGSAENADTLLEDVDRSRAQMVLIDMNMPGRDPIEAINELSAAHPELRIVALSGYVHEDVVDRALGAGACGYIAKDEDLATIIHSLHQIADGQVVFSPLVLKHYASAGRL
jgi:DNA-binding NarL/FixJ family response regulator